MDQYDFSDPNYDFGGRSAILARRLREASAQANAEIGPEKGQMVGGFYVAPNIGQYINAAAQKILGARDVARAEAEQEALNKEQLRRYEDISKQLATPGTKTVLKRTLEGKDVEEQAPLDYSNPDDLAADNARRMGLASQMMKLSLPQAQKVAQDYLTRGVAFPDTLAQLQMKLIDQGQQNAQRLAENERLDKLFRLTAEQQYEIGKAGAANKGIGLVDTVDAAGNPVKQVYDKANLVPGQTFAKPADKPSSAAEKGMNAAQTLKDKATQAIELLKKNPDAVGWKTLIPNILLQRTHPEGVGTRMRVGELSAEKSHELYGAAFTTAEMARAGKFLPQDGDDYETTLTKLEGMRDIAAEAEARWGKGRKAIPAEPSGSGAPGSTNPQDIANFEQHYNSLQPGQRYIDPNGVPRIKGGS